MQMIVQKNFCILPLKGQKTLQNDDLVQSGCESYIYSPRHLTHCHYIHKTHAWFLNGLRPLHTCWCLWQAAFGIWWRLGIFPKKKKVRERSGLKDSFIIFNCFSRSQLFSSQVNNTDTHKANKLFSPHPNSGIREEFARLILESKNHEQFCLWNPKFWALEYGIPLKESEILLKIGIKNV